MNMKKEVMERAISNAAASSAMEGLPLSIAQIQTVEDILSGRLLMEDYLIALQARYRED